MFCRLVVMLCALAAAVVSLAVDTTTRSIFTCPAEYGLFADPDDCHSFYECNEWIPLHFICPSQLGYDATVDECNYMPSCP